MKITVNPNLITYLLGSKPIGIGTTAICFLMPNGNVLKLYHNKYFQKEFSQENYIAHFETLNKITNDTYIGPEELLIKENCLGYIYPYVLAKTLHKSVPILNSKYIIDKYPKLIEDTKNISDRNFLLNDLHDRNILIGSIINIIDLDRGEINNKLSKEHICNYNLAKINKIFIYSLFNVKDDELIDFSDNNIQELYSLSIGREPTVFPELLKYIESKYNPTQENIYQLRKRIPYQKRENSYYRYF